MMAALDRPGQRWRLCVSWELPQDQSLGVGELRRRTGEVSSSVLADRFRRRAEAGLVATGEDGRHSLTDPGDAPGAALEPLRAWAPRWAAGAGQPGAPLDKRICQDKG
jgi:DNA-binding HxlR family transcriptional regulator